MSCCFVLRIEDTLSIPAGHIPDPTQWKFKAIEKLFCLDFKYMNWMEELRVLLGQTSDERVCYYL